MSAAEEQHPAVLLQSLVHCVLHSATHLQCDMQAWTRLCGPETMARTLVRVMATQLLTLTSYEQHDFDAVM